MITNETIGEMLRELRLEQDISQSEAASRVGIGRTALNNYEQGRRVPDFDVTSNLLEMYGWELEIVKTIC